MKRLTTWILPIALLLIAGMPGFSAEPDDGQEAAIAAIKKLGGRVELDRNKAVVRVYFSGDKVTDAGMKNLKGLKSLRVLTVFDAKVTSLEHLRGLTKIDYLDFDNTPITDAGLEHLKGLTKLHYLGLTEAKVTDAALNHLKELKSLRILVLTDVGITDAGAKKFRSKLRQALPNCLILFLERQKR